MTKEEFQKFLEDPENKETFDAVVESLGYEKPDGIEGLKKNNQAILSEKKKIQAERDELKKKLDEVDMDEYIRLKKSSGTNGQQSELDAKIAKLSREIESERESKRSVTEKYHSRLIESELSNLLESNEYKTHKNALKQILRSRATVEESDGKDIFTIKDDDGISYTGSDYFKSVFPKTELGTQYKDQPINVGGGSRAVGGSGGMKKMSESEFNRLSPKDQAILMKSKTS